MLTTTRLLLPLSTTILSSSVIDTLPPFLVNLTALLTKLEITWVILPLSG